MKVCDGQSGWELGFRALHGLKGESTYYEIIHRFAREAEVDFRRREKPVPLLSDLDPAITKAAEALDLTKLDCNFHVQLNLSGIITMNNDNNNTFITYIRILIRIHANDVK